MSDRVRRFGGLTVDPEVCQRSGEPKGFCLTGRPICQAVARDVAVLSGKTGSRPRLIEYRNEPVRGAEDFKEHEEGPVLTIRRSTISSKYLIRCSK
jgi:hypothetical protein